MLSKVHGIMFLSTPHRGSQYARTLNNFLSITLGASKVYVSELESSSTSIEDISEQFRGICGPWKLASLYETLSTKFLSGVRRLVSAFAIQMSPSTDDQLGTDSWQGLRRSELPPGNNSTCGRGPPHHCEIQRPKRYQLYSRH